MVQLSQIVEKSRKDWPGKKREVMKTQRKNLNEREVLCQIKLMVVPVENSVSPRVRVMPIDSNINNWWTVRGSVV